MTGYVRIDTINNIADGNVISAADLDGEFNGVQAAFNSSTGHTHDGTASEGAPITKLGPSQNVTVSTIVLGVATTNTVDLGTSSLKFKDFYLAGAASIGGTLGVTSTATFTGAVIFNGNATIGDADTDTITQAASYVTGTQLKSAKTATNTLSLAAYDVDGTAYTNLITLTASNTPTLALTSTGVGTINNMSIGATTASTGAFTTLTSNAATTFTAGTASTTTGTGTLVITGGLGVSGRINAANFDGIVGANTAAAGSFTTLSATGATTITAQLTASTGDGTYPIISKDTRAFSAGVTGPQLGFFGLDSTSTNNSLGAIRALAQTSQNGTLESRVLSGGSITTVGTFSSTGLAVTGALSASTSISTGTGNTTTAGLKLINGTAGFASGWGAIYAESVTPSNLNFIIAGRWDGLQTNINTATGGLIINSVNNSEVTRVSSTGLAVTGNTTSPTLQLGTNPAGVSIGVLGIPNQKRIYGRNAANSADVNILYVDGSNGLVLGPSDAAVIDSSGNLTVTGNIRTFVSPTLTLLANQFTDIVYIGAGGFGAQISGILTVYSTYSGAITQNSYFCNAIGNGNAGNGVSMLANGDYSGSSNFILYSRGSVLGGGSYVISVYNASGTTVGITYSFAPVGFSNSASYYSSLSNSGSAGAGTGLPSGVSVVFGQNNAQVKASGVTFPATQAASSDANTLDDYEEGAIDGTSLGLAYSTPGTSSFTYSDRRGTYTKVGRVVYFTLDIRLASFSKGTASGGLFVVGLPFAQRDTSGFDGARCTVQLYEWTYTTSPIIAVVGSNATNIQITRMVSNAVTADIDDPDGNSIIWVTGFYFV